MLLTPKHLRAGDFGISVFRYPGKGVPIMMELQPDTDGELPDSERICPVRVKSKNIQENAEIK